MVDRSDTPAVASGQRSDTDGDWPPRAFTSREDFIRFVARQRSEINKEDLIARLCTGQDVLDLGCVDHSAQRFLALGDKCLHSRLKQVSRSVVGVDILQDEIAILNAAGYDIRVANVESFDLGEVYDIVVAADLIEHLMNVGSFLDSVARHMRKDSLFVISTPNPFNVEQTMRAIFEQKIGVNVEHTCWLDPIVMYQLISRSPFEIVDLHWVQTRFKMKCLMFPFKYVCEPAVRVDHADSPIVSARFCRGAQAETCCPRQSCVVTRGARQRFTAR